MISISEILDKGISLMAGGAAIYYSRRWKNKPGYEKKAKWIFYCGVLVILCTVAVLIFQSI